MSTGTRCPLKRGQAAGVFWGERLSILGTDQTRPATKRKCGQQGAPACLSRKMGSRANLGEKRKLVGWEEKICDIILLAMTQIICLWPTPAYLRGSNENCVVSFYKGQFKMRWGRSNTVWAAPGRFLPRPNFFPALLFVGMQIFYFLNLPSFPLQTKRPHLSIYATLS